MMDVMCVIIRSIEDSYIPIDFLYSQLGINIPKYAVIEDSDIHNPEYIICVDAKVDFLDIVQELGYKCLHFARIPVEEDKYNKNYIIQQRDDYGDTFYELVKYERMATA